MTRSTNPSRAGLLSLFFTGLVIFLTPALGRATPITSGLQLWLDGTDIDGDTVADTLPLGSVVTNWKDKSPSALTATQSNASYRPITGDLNGHQIVSFTGDDYLTLAGGPTGHQTLFVVYRDISTQAWVTPVGTTYNGHGSYHGNNNDGSLFNGTYTDSATRNGDNYVGGAPTIGNGDGTPRPDNWTINAYVATGPLPQTVTTIGADGCCSNGRAINGGIGDVILYNRALSNSELDSVGNYLAGKYGLTWNSINVAAGPAEGSFETPNLGAGNFQYAPSGSAWTFTGGAGLANSPGVFTSGNPAPPDGAQVAFLQGTAAVQQSVNTFVPNAKYSLGWSHANRGDFGGDNNLIIELDDGVNPVYTLFNSGGVITDTNWASNTSLQFVPRSGTATLRIRTTNPGGGDNTTLVDAVAINQEDSAGATTFTSRASGNWSDPNIWDPIGSPQSLDTGIVADGHDISYDPAASGSVQGVTINSAAGTSSLTLGKDLQVTGTTLMQGGGLVQLDLNGHNLTTTTLTLADTATGIVRTGGGNITATTVNGGGNSTIFSMAPGDVITTIQTPNASANYNLQGTITNLAWTAFVSASPQVNLIGDLLITGGADARRGSLNLNDKNLTVNGNLNIGGTNNYAYGNASMTRSLAGETLTVGGTFYNSSYGAVSMPFASGDSLGALSAGKGPVTVTQYAGAENGLTITGSSLANLSIKDATGQLTLLFDDLTAGGPLAGDPLTFDWALRWNGDHEATLESWFGGRLAVDTGLAPVTFSAVDNIYYSNPLDGGDGYTYIGFAQTETVPEPGALALALVGLAGLGLLAWRRRK